MPGSQQVWESDVTWNPWSADFDFSGEHGDQRWDVVRSAAGSLHDDDRRVVEKMNLLSISHSDSGLKGDIQGSQINGMPHLYYPQIESMLVQVLLPGKRTLHGG